MIDVKARGVVEGEDECTIDDVTTIEITLTRTNT